MALKEEETKALSSHTQAQVVFSTPAVYHPAVVLLLIFSLSVPIVTLLFTYSDEQASAEEKKMAVRVLITTMVAIAIVFSLVLPRAFDVVSDASMNVTTIFGIKWNFTSITASYKLDSLFSEWTRPKFKFATDLRNRVVVRRKNGRWDVLVSPKDADGFVQAVWSIAGEVEGSDEQNNCSLHDFSSRRACRDNVYEAPAFAQ